MSKEYVEVQLPEETYEKLEAYAKRRGVTVEDALKIVLTEAIEIFKAKREGKEVIFLYDYGDKGFIISMPYDLPQRDPEHKKSKVVEIKMPEYAKYPA